MARYNLEHLTQPENQEVIGPIQDDEALLLYAIVRTNRIKNILEVGGLSGYSARNFLSCNSDGLVFTVDINKVEPQSDRHICIQKNCKDISSNDIVGKVDMLFFDAHVYDEQIQLFHTLEKCGSLSENLIIALHDTNLHPYKIGGCPDSFYVESQNGWCHQKVERQMVNYFKSLGYDSISFHTSLNEKSISYRHGLTIMKKFEPLLNE